MHVASSAIDKQPRRGQTMRDGHGMVARELCVALVLVGVGVNCGGTEWMGCCVGCAARAKEAKPRSKKIIDLLSSSGLGFAGQAEGESWKDREVD